MQVKSLAALLLVVGALTGSGRAAAQTVAVVEQVMVGVTTQSKQLDSALTNLAVISKSLHGAEEDSADVIASAGRQFSGAVGETTPVGLVLRHMKSRHDIRFTRTVLVISASRALLAADSDLAIIDAALPQIVTPAAVAESIRVRNSILVTRHLLHEFTLTAAMAARVQTATDERVAAR